MSILSNAKHQTRSTMRFIASITGFRGERVEFAHPWTKYAAPTYLAGRAPEGIVIATRAAGVVALAVPENNTGHCADVSVRDEMRPVPGAHLLRLIVNPHEIGETQRSAMTSAPMASAAASRTRTNFRLAARLQSVSKLNRIGQASVTPAPTVGCNALRGQRPVLTKVEAKRSRSIVTPALSRRPRKSGEVISLELALARAEQRRTRLAWTG